VQADLDKEAAELALAGSGTTEKPNFPALVDRFEPVLHRQMARQPKHQEETYVAYPAAVDKNLRDGCKAYDDARASEVSARAYLNAKEAGKDNVKRIEYGPWLFYVFAVAPKQNLDDAKASQLVRLLCLPPAADRNIEFLKKGGLFHRDRLPCREYSGSCCVIRCASCSCLPPPLCPITHLRFPKQMLYIIVSAHSD
jgi:hypothetical protein